jgi:hypothetical protein
MPITFEIDSARGRLRTVVDGSVSVGEVAEHVQSLVSRKLERLADLIDARSARGPGWYAADVRKAATMIEAIGGAEPFGPRAIVVSSSAAFGMVRMLSVLLGSRLRLEAFRDMESAERWLNGAGTTDAA